MFFFLPKNNIGGIRCIIAFFLNDLFYFFEKDGQIGISFDDEILMLGFEEILHYGCCSAGMLNPIQAQNMVAFFAQREGTWYYVEIGVFK